MSDCTPARQLNAPHAQHPPPPTPRGALLGRADEAAQEAQRPLQVRRQQGSTQTRLPCPRAGGQEPAALALHTSKRRVIPDVFVSA